MPFAKKVNATVPVGVSPARPDTVAWSVTDEPSAADVTGAPPCMMLVAVEEPPLLTVSASHGPVEPA